MKNFLILLLVPAVFACSNKETGNYGIRSGKAGTYQSTGKIEKLDEELEQVIETDAKIEILAEGFKWAEGPVWVTEGDYLLFSDIPDNKIYKWKETEGVSDYLSPSGYTGKDRYSEEPGSNGLMVNRDGQLVLCQHGDRRIAKMEADLDEPEPVFAALVDQYQGKKLNSPNDLAEFMDGSVYFTDPPYGLPGKQNSTIRELDIFGVYRLSPDGIITLLTDNLTRPNGIAFNPDFKTCYVNVSDKANAVTMAYDIMEDGSFANERILFDAASLIPGRKGLPDGLRTHPGNGYIFSTGPGGVLVLTPEGKHLGTIHTGQATSNCAFGNDLSYLYMTADSFLLRVKLKKTNPG